MAIQLQSTAGLHARGVKVLVYGAAGAGKTSLISTLPEPLVLSAEGGLLSLSWAEVPYIEIKSIADVREAFQFITQSEEAQQFKSIALDSISEIAEVCLTAEKTVAKDPRQAYGAMQDEVTKLIRAFRDLPGKHVYFSAKMEKSQDEMGRMLYAPSMPGNKMGQQLPYFFDEVLALRIERDQEGNTQRALMCDSDGLWSAKDRSGRLSMWEAPNLSAVIDKIGGEA